MVKHTRKKGGSFIARGASGCVFGKPPLKCKNENARRNNRYVTKYMNYTYAKKEQKETENWHLIDPENKFSITPVRLCEYDNSNFKVSNERNKCKYLKVPVEKEGLLVYKDGGVDLFNLKVKANNYAYLFGAFHDLLKGLTIAHDNNIIHNDIKLDNILAERQERKIHLRFIDFGLSYSVDNEKAVDYYINGAYKNFFYQYWPLEIKFIDKTTLSDGKYFIEKISKFKADDYPNLKVIAPKSIFLNPKTNKIYKTEELFDLYRSLDLEDYLDRIDVYGIGITISMLVLYYLKHKQDMDTDGKTHMMLYLPNKQHPVSIDSLDELKDDTLTQEIIDWHKTVEKNLTTPLYNLLSKMLQLNPKERYTAEEARDEYKKLIPLIYKYLKDDKMIEKVYTMYPDFLDKTPTIKSEPSPSPPYNLYKLFGNDEKVNKKIRRRNNYNLRQTKKRKLYKN